MAWTKLLKAKQIVSDYVLLTTNQTIAGIKTFSSSPIIPNGSASNHAAAIGQLNASVAVFSKTFFVNYEVDTSGVLKELIINNSKTTIDGVTFTATVADVNLADQEILIEASDAVFVLESGIPKFSVALTPATANTSTYGRMNCERVDNTKIVIALPYLWSAQTQLIYVQILF